MARGQKPGSKQSNREPEASSTGKVSLGLEARDNYKARLVKGLLDVDLGEGYIVEVVNYRTKKVLRRELFEDSDDARAALARIRDDIKSLTTDEFRRMYLQPPR